MELHPRDARGHTPRFTGRLRRAVIPAALFQTRKASAGEGFNLHGRVVATRQVPAHPMRLRFVGTHMAASPMHEVAARLMGTVQRVEGEVDFEPVDTDGCRVTGAISPEQSCAFSEEGWSRAAVAERVCAIADGGEAEIETVL